MQKGMRECRFAENAGLKLSMEERGEIQNSVAVLYFYLLNLATLGRPLVFGPPNKMSPFSHTMLLWSFLNLVLAGPIGSLYILLK